MIWLLLAAPIAVLWFLDRQARIRGLRLGSWTKRLPWFRRGRVWVRGTPMRLDGWCENCGTGWRYALPWVTFIRRDPSSPVTAIVVVCQKCRADLPLDHVVQRYARWWVDKNERTGEADPREFEDIRAALRVGG
jgi:hypothetical protein